MYQLAITVEGQCHDVMVHLYAYHIATSIATKTLRSLGWLDPLPSDTQLAVGCEETKSSWRVAEVGADIVIRTGNTD
jgi:hypothetical protein